MQKDKFALPLFGPYTASCFPFLDPSSNCCAGGQEGAVCNSAGDCRGLLTCSAGSCVGTSGCETACTVNIGGAPYDCCVPEAWHSGTCTSDVDCQGARYCTESGFCAGSSGCESKTSGQKIVYDRECVCTQMGSFCSYSQGIPCADGCDIWSPAPDTLICARIDQWGSSETLRTVA